MTHEDGKPHIMSRRFEIIISAIIGPMVVIIAVGVWAASVRTRANVQSLTTMVKQRAADMEQNAVYESRVMRRFGEMEGRLQEVEELAPTISEVQTKADGAAHVFEMVVIENREAHQRIIKQMDASNEEFHDAMIDLKTDLIREFHKANGHGKK